MFSLLLGLWNHLFTKAEVHILIAGLDDAGKTVRTISAVCFPHTQPVWNRRYWSN